MRAGASRRRAIPSGRIGRSPPWLRRRRVAPANRAAGASSSIRSPADSAALPVGGVRPACSCCRCHATARTPCRLPSRSCARGPAAPRSEEHTSELQSHHPNSYAVFCLKKKKKKKKKKNKKKKKKKKKEKKKKKKKK